jgi:DNA-binding MurR/RpiR family transcriptional regulator
MSSSGTLAEHLADVGDDLTPTERRIAEAVLADPTALAFETVAEMATRVNTSGATIVRFAAKLGFEGYRDLQDAARASLAAQLHRPTDRIRQAPRSETGQDSTWERARAVATEGIDDVFANTSAADVVALAAPLAACRGSVWVLGAETSAAAHHVLASGLRLLRPGVRHLGGSRAEIAVEVADAEPGDVAVVIDFARYEHTVVDTARRLSDLGVHVTAITDSPLSPLAAIADRWCAVTVGAIGPFDSTLPAVALVEVLLAELADQLRETAAARLDRTEALWAANDVYLPGEATH